MAQQLEVGARGWDHPGWVGSFYPESLPPEWRLTYFSNEFFRVLVPASEWVKAETLPEWCGEVHERFGFLLELALPEGESLLPALKPALDTLRPCLAGVVLRVDAGAPVALLETVRNAIGEDVSLCVDLPVPAPRDWRDAAASTGVAVCWRPAHDNWLRGSSVGLLGEETRPGDRRALRALVESFLEQAGATEERVLLFEGDPPYLSSMHDVQIMATLLAEA